LRDAISLQEAGVFSIVLELIPLELAKEISNNLDIPTIGIGAGIYCDGQVQVFHDILGLDPDFRPKHSGNYADLSSVIKQALQNFSDEVTGRKFPRNEQSFSWSKDDKKNG
jgi:3-methyl-2-oxobutanoate hydroxymethyltransferase